MSMIPFQNRENFFRDPFFSDCWSIMEKNYKSFFDRSFKDFQDKSFKEFSDNFSIDNFRKNENSTMNLFSFNNEVQSDDDNFKVMLDVQQFSPKEIEVKTIDNCLIIEGKHEEKDTNNQVLRQFSRKYTLPSDVKPERVECNMSSDGVLVISAPKNPKPKLAITASEKVVPIQQTGRMSSEKKTSFSSTNNYSSNSNNNSNSNSLSNGNGNNFIKNSLSSPFSNFSNSKEHNINIEVEGSGRKVA